MPNLRQAARVVVLSPENRVLLVHFEFETGAFWATPGGGVEGDETRIEAGERELREETGIVGLELVGPIWERTHHFGFYGFDGQHELYFLARTPDENFAPQFTPDELRAEGVTELQWWHPDDIVASTERFAPRDLGQRVLDLMADGPPVQLITLSDEHPPATNHKT